MTAEVVFDKMPMPPPHVSWQELVRRMDADGRAEFLAGFTPQQIKMLPYHWPYIARAEQLPPEGDWFVWLMNAGRGFGKTRGGAEWLIEEHRHNGAQNSAIVGATSTDVRRYCIEGRSGILRCAPVKFRPIYQPSKLRLKWPNGTESHIYTADQPDRLRGPNHDRAWCDELAAWRYLAESWDNLDMTLREANNPQICCTTTPKPKKMLREIIADADTIMTTGSTFENASNLSGRWLARMERRYGGTRKGEQELYARLLDEAEGALWERAWIEARRLKEMDVEKRRVGVGVDPAASDTEESSETGIIVSCVGQNQRGYVLEDLSGRYSPDGWARAAILAYFRWGANAIIAERNNGGDMVVYTIRMTAQAMKAKGEIPTAEIPVVVKWASHGKAARAEPVAAMYEQGRMSHVGVFGDLEDQLCNWEPSSGDRSPDRLDALVWVFTYLMLEGEVDDTVGPVGIDKASPQPGV